MAVTMDELAAIVTTAIKTGQVEAYQELLAPDARWGPGDQPEWGCHNRKDILAWLKNSQGKGMRATVTEVMPAGDALLIGLSVQGTPGAVEAGGSAVRWQVLTVKDGLITDVSGFDNRAEAAARAGLS